MGGVQTSSFAMAVLIFILAAHDSAFTEGRIKKYGPDVEVNWAVWQLIPFVGLQWSLALGIMIPTLAIVSILAANNLTIPLAMWLGAKLLNLRYQYLSLQLEKEIDRLRTQQAKDRNSGTVTSSSPSDSSHPGDGQ